MTEQEVIKAMHALGADKESGTKSVDDIARKANRTSGLVANILSVLVGKKAVKRVLKDKAARYYAVR